MDFVKIVLHCVIHVRHQLKIVFFVLTSELIHLAVIALTVYFLNSIRWMASPLRPVTSAFTNVQHALISLIQDSLA